MMPNPALYGAGFHSVIKTMSSSLSTNCTFRDGGLAHSTTISFRSSASRDEVGIGPLWNRLLYQSSLSDRSRIFACKRLPLARLRVKSRRAGRTLRCAPSTRTRGVLARVRHPGPWTDGPTSPTFWRFSANCAVPMPRSSARHVADKSAAVLAVLLRWWQSVSFLPLL